MRHLSLERSVWALVVVEVLPFVASARCDPRKLAVSRRGRVPGGAARCRRVSARFSAKRANASARKGSVSRSVVGESAAWATMTSIWWAR